MVLSASGGPTIPPNLPLVLPKALLDSATNNCLINTLVGSLNLEKSNLANGISFGNFIISEFSFLQSSTLSLVVS